MKAAPVVLLFLLLSLNCLAQKMTDRDFDRLKGKVKNVSETGTISDKDGTRPGFDTETAYDINGNHVLNIYYFGGTKTIYYVVDGKKASKSEHFQDDPRVKMFLLGTTGTIDKKKRDDRYEFLYEYDYDDKGRIVEQRKFANDGILKERTVYKYDQKSNRVSEIEYQGKDKWSETTLTYDADGRLIREITTYFKDSDRFDSRYSGWKFDVAGNWIERKESSYDRTVRWNEPSTSGARSHTTKSWLDAGDAF